MDSRFFRSLLTVLFVVFFAEVAWATDFSADVFTEGPMGSMQSKVYSRDGILRQDMTTPMGRTATITWKDEDRCLLLMLDQKTYMEFEESDEGMGGAFSDMDDFSDLEGEPGVSRMGSEEIQGFSCEKFVVVDPEMPDGKSTIWFSEELGFPLKTVYESPQGNMTIECRNVSRETPDASLFEVPPGFQKLDMPMGMSPGMMGMPDQD